jgi:hypothetical protein
MKTRLRPLALALVLAASLAPSCASTEEAWSFGLTRSMLDVLPAPPPGARVPDGRDGRGASWMDEQPISNPVGDSLAVMGGILILVPLAFDVVLLPVAIVHDLWPE